MDAPPYSLAQQACQPIRSFTKHAQPGTCVRPAPAPAQPTKRERSSPAPPTPLPTPTPTPTPSGSTSAPGPSGSGSTNAAGTGARPPPPSRACSGRQRLPARSGVAVTPSAAGRLSPFAWCQPRCWPQRGSRRGSSQSPAVGPISPQAPGGGHNATQLTSTAASLTVRLGHQQPPASSWPNVQRCHVMAFGAAAGTAARSAGAPVMQAYEWQDA